MFFLSVVTRMPKITKKRFNKHYFSANNISISLNTLNNEFHYENSICMQVLNDF